MEGELKELKSVLRSLVVSSPAALNAQALLRDYRGMMGASLPISRFGYRDPISFLREQCADCFLFQGPSRNPTLTLIVPDSLKHIDKFVQKQKTAMKGKVKRRSVPESTIYPPQKNLISSTFSNIKNTGTSPVLSKKTENTNSAQPRPIVGSSTTKQYVPTSALNNKVNEVNCNSTSRRDSGSYSEDNPANAVPNFFKKRMPLLESLQNLDLEDEKETNLGDDNKSGRQNSDSGRHTSSSSSSSKQLQIEILKQEIFNIVDEYPDGVLCADLIKLYRERHGKELNYSRLGHMSLASAAVAMGLRAAPAHGDYRLGRHTPPPAPRAPRAPRAPPAAAPSAARPDCDDALPGVEYDADVFPADCLHYMDSIPGVDVSWVRPGDTVDVLPAEVYSPSHLWLILLGDQHHAAMEQVMDDMNLYYKKGSGAARALAPGAVRVGHYCACLYEADWHRAIIVRVVDCDTVKVRHIDYGTVQTVRARALRPLLRRFAELPAQAVRARLAGARPNLRARRWQHCAALRLLAMLRDTPHVAAAAHRQDDILEVYLINTTGAEDVCVNEELIREGYAEAAPSPAAGVHLAPAFGALEGGATPSLHDCLTYLRDGIDLDYVADYRAHVPPLLPPAAAPPPAPSPAPSPAPPPSPPPEPRRVMRYPPRPASPPAPPASPPSQPAAPPASPPAPPPVQYCGPAPPTQFCGPTPRLPLDALQWWGGAYVPVAPPPGFGWGGSAWARGGLSAAERELLQLAARVQPALARRFVAERLAPARAPLNPLAPEFHYPRY